jgi:hypothetical protein
MGRLSIRFSSAVAFTEISVMLVKARKARCFFIVIAFSYLVACLTLCGQHQPKVKK